MKKALIVIDMQNDFIDGSLGTAEAQAIIAKAVEKINARRSQGWDILATLDTHDEHYLDSREGAALPVVHCVKGSDGWQMQPAIAEACGNAPRFEKAGFGSPELAVYLKAHEYTEVEFIGVCTDICVISNAILARSFLPDAAIRVDSTACAGVTPIQHQAALDALKPCQVEVV